MNEDEPRHKELISVPGVEGKYEKYWFDGTEIIYYCDLCTDEPSNDDPKKTVVVLRHDDCARERAKYGLAKMQALNDRLEAELDVIRNKMANDILSIDPDAEI